MPRPCGLFAREDVRAAVIGLPVNMDAAKVLRPGDRAFVRNIERLTDMPFAYLDERLSTVAAERTLIEMDVSRAKRGSRIDLAAAAFILQGALDRLRALSSSRGPRNAPSYPGHRR